MKQCLSLLVCGVFLVIACTTRPPWKDPDVLNLPILPPDSSLVNNLQCQSYCSETKLRTGVALLTWDADKRLIRKQRIDVTVYKHGFETRTYTILWPLRKDQRFQTSDMANIPDRPDRQLLYLKVNKADWNRHTNTISIELEGLQPGLNYFWRVLTLEKQGWRPGITIRCVGPVCPADTEES